MAGAQLNFTAQGLISDARRSMIGGSAVLVPASYAWKILLAVALGGAILASAYAKAPRRSFPRAELRRLVLAAVLLYVVGMVASLNHRPALAAALYAAGIAISALAAWLSRGNDSGGGPPPGDDPVDEQPPPDPDGIPRFDWSAFEREFRDYARRSRDPATIR
jgi:hypothetical protein